MLVEVPRLGLQRRQQFTGASPSFGRGRDRTACVCQAESGGGALQTMGQATQEAVCGLVQVQLQLACRGRLGRGTCQQLCGPVLSPPTAVLPLAAPTATCLSVCRTTFLMSRSRCSNPQKTVQFTFHMDFAARTTVTVQCFSFGAITRSAAAACCNALKA